MGKKSLRRRKRETLARERDYWRLTQILKPPGREWREKLLTGHCTARERRGLLRLKAGARP
jgi:hypothetical protein